MYHIYHVNITSYLSEWGHEETFLYFSSFQPSDLSTESARRGAGQLQFTGQFADCCTNIFGSYFLNGESEIFASF